MSLSTMLRFTAPTLLRHRLLIPLLAVSTAPNNLRFFSPSPKRSLQIRSSKRRDKEEPVLEKGEEGGNGGVLVKEKGSRAGDGRIVPTELHKEATEAYMAYAMSVLLGRALPDVRDGLKPVHRRIL